MMCGRTRNWCTCSCVRARQARLDSPENCDTATSHDFVCALFDAFSVPLTPVLVPLPDLPHTASRQGPFALLGHSMGAWLAYEVAQELTRRGAPVAPCAVFVSANRWLLAASCWILTMLLLLLLLLPPPRRPPPPPLPPPLPPRPWPCWVNGTVIPDALQRWHPTSQEVGSSFTTPSGAPTDLLSPHPDTNCQGAPPCWRVSRRRPHRAAPAALRCLLGGV
jgi:hypothetical protein